MIKSVICERLGIEKPLFQGGMAWIADARLAAAVSNAGGLGLISSILGGPEAVRAEIRKAKKLTDKPFGVNVMLADPNAAAVADLVVEEGVGVVTTGAGSPAPYMERWKAAGIRVIPVVASVAYALKMQELGATAVIAEGAESGGHIGDTNTLALLPQILDAVEIPVLAAGGVFDGRSAAAMLLMGACGVQVGTRFLVADECRVHETYKERLIKASDVGTMVTGNPSGTPSAASRPRSPRNSPGWRPIRPSRPRKSAPSGRAPSGKRFSTATSPAAVSSPGKWRALLRGKSPRRTLSMISSAAPSACSPARPI